MPRQDVPYGGAICRLKERIAEIWDKLDEKLHSINGVEGDGAGNVDIVSGNAAVVINNDQIGHKIEVTLDSSKLPASSVSSVNGQTGAVMLDAAHIPGNENLSVQQSIDLNKASINDCFDSITSEQTARQATDAVLQTNINTVSASIPEMSAAPDPYKGIERDAQGRAFAADPAAGATDKTLVTANWVSQTGDDAPNNVAHRNGNETYYGDKTFVNSLNASIKKGRITPADTLDLFDNYDGINIYYIFSSNVSSVPGVPTNIDNGGAILFNQRIYAWTSKGITTSWFSQLMISSTGNLYTRRHTRTYDNNTSTETWGNENWKQYQYTTVTPI